MSSKEFKIIKRIVKYDLKCCYSNYKFALFIFIVGIYTIMSIPYFMRPSLVRKNISIHFLEGIILNFNNPFYITTISIFFLFNILDILYDKRISLLTIIRIKKRSIYNIAKLISLYISSIIHAFIVVCFNIFINMCFLEINFSWSSFAKDEGIRLLQSPLNTLIISFLLVTLWLIIVAYFANLLDILINSKLMGILISLLGACAINISFYAKLNLCKIVILRYQDTINGYSKIKISCLILISMIVFKQILSNYFIRKKNFYR